MRKQSWLLAMVLATFVVMLPDSAKAELGMVFRATPTVHVPPASNRGYVKIDSVNCLGGDLLRRVAGCLYTPYYLWDFHSASKPPFGWDEHWAKKNGKVASYPSVFVPEVGLLIAYPYIFDDQGETKVFPYFGPVIKTTTPFLQNASWRLGADFSTGIFVVRAVVEFDTRLPHMKYAEGAVVWKLAQWYYDLSYLGVVAGVSGTRFEERKNPKALPMFGLELVQGL